MFKLIVHQTGQGDKEFQLEGRTYSVGRSTGNDIVLLDESASRHHALINFENDEFYIEDKQSAGGVYVNDNRITQKTMLRGGDVIKIGSTLIDIVTVIETGTFPSVTDDSEAKTKVISPDEYQNILQANQKEEPGMEPSVQNLADSQKAGDKTVLFDIRKSPDASPPSFHKLVVISDADLGKEYSLKKPENMIGRAPGCPVLVNDKMASAQHAMITVKGNDCFIKDLNSTNGTVVNGKKLTAQQALAEGDEIEIGASIFKFIHKDSVIDKDAILGAGKKKKPDSKKPLKLVAAVLAAVVVFLVFVVIFSKPKPQQKQVPSGDAVKESVDASASKEPAEEIQTKESAPSDDVIKEKTAQLYFSMANQFRTNQLWQAAIDKYIEVLAIDPGFLEAQEALEQAKFELQNEQMLNKGRELVSVKNYDKAIEVLQIIPLESVYYHKSKELVADITKQKPETATTQPQKPVEPEVKEILPAVDVQTEANKLIEQALDNYAKGDLTGAQGNLEAVLKMDLKDYRTIASAVEDLQANMEEAQEGFDRGLNAYKSNQMPQAFQIWSDVLETDRKIIGKRSSYIAGQIATYTADEYGHQAQKAFDKEEYEIALAKSMEALNAQPGHPGALQIQEQLITKAKKLYEKAYILEDLDHKQAVEIWEQVVKICPPTNEYYVKAKSRIQKYK
jgi:pSer/pThr/pTyr-binding forkhead associated (FHA) protein